MTTTATERILIVRAGALGDTLMTTPAIRRLHEGYPHAEIDCLASGAGAALLASNPHLARIYTLNQRNIPVWLSSEKRELIRQLRERRYRFAVVLESAERYRELVERAGVAEIRDFKTGGFDSKRHSILNNIRAAGLEVSNADLRMDLPVPENAVTAAARMVKDLPRPLVALHAGCGPASKKNDRVNRLKGWSTANFAAVADTLATKGCGLVLTGSKEDVGLCEEIVNQCRVAKPMILAGRTSVPELAAVIQSADLMISVDSGPAHMAAALRTPLIVLWGPAILDQVRPVSPDSPVHILTIHAPCAPCYGTPAMKTCERNICMEGITPQMVLNCAAPYLRR